MNIEEQPFVWAVGIEDTFVTQVERGERPLDEYELTQHYQFWKEDLDRARNIGASMIRYGIPWHRVEAREGFFNWSWVDQVMDYFKQHPDLTPIIDLMHYGTPHWLKNEFAHGRYPEYVSRYAKEFAKRYGDFVKYYTPLNEPYVNAEFCGLNAVWPPYLEGLNGFYSMIVQLGKGIIQTVREVTSIVPDARFVHVDATKRYITYDPLLKSEAELWNENRFIMWELIQGRIDQNHPLYHLMLEYGISPDILKWFKEHRIELDIVGLNYYPQFSVHEVKRDNKGYIIYPHVLGRVEDFEEIVKEAYKRYNRPIMITETSYRGSENERIQWLHDCYKACLQIRKEHIPLLGLTWFPFMDLVDWGYRTSGKTVEEELLPFGLYSLTMKEGILHRVKNRVGFEFEKLVKKQ